MSHILLLPGHHGNGPSPLFLRQCRWSPQQQPSLHEAGLLGVCPGPVCTSRKTDLGSVVRSHDHRPSLVKLVSNQHTNSKLLHTVPGLAVHIAVVVY